ncbi:LemA family protein [Marinobacterium sediminicola]|uniref:LemA protein n=1 Tax=Marinobacterium sediminicola TaxID=518898 RepID=A0ABY1RWP4_9GAMM|nr:LemA family protein [Marinobacterium sediminicola]ULG70267.1 LemA family protein [Marinobacterium sediminicola]SMR69906.1 LemA protein [Marinobacterium sediminicola]
MDISLIIVLAIIVVAALYFVSLYNHLVRLKHGVSRAWANIDVLLKQRHDELPKLVETCKQHMGYEQDTLTAVIEARSAVAKAREQGDVGALGQAETQLRLGLGNLFAVAEDYPELTASDSFHHLRSRITGLESGIADRREYYNDSVNHLNVRIEQFPDVIIARRFGFKPAQLLEFDEAEKADVNIQQLFG